MTMELIGGVAVVLTIVGLLVAGLVFAYRVFSAYQDGMLNAEYRHDAGNHREGVLRAAYMAGRAEYERRAEIRAARRAGDGR
jgi:hypothetical protein